MQKSLLFIIAVFLFFTSLVYAGDQQSERCFIAYGNAGAVSSGHSMASQAAVNVLRNGGNAVDAAVCAAFMLGVVDFSNSGIGGDGFALIRTPGGQIHAWDATNKSPKTTDRSQLTNSIGLPTTVKLLTRLRKIYGSKSLSELINPAIDTCKNGFKINAYLQNIVEKKLLDIKDPTAISFLTPHGYPIRAGQILKQPLLAKTLNQIANDEGRSFYTGKMAKKLLNDMSKRGSLYRSEDFALHRVIPAEAFSYKYGDYEIFGNPPPSSSLVTAHLAITLLKSGMKLWNQNYDDIIKTAKIFHELLELKNNYLAASYSSPNVFESAVRNLLTKSMDFRPCQTNRLPIGNKKNHNKFSHEKDESESFTNTTHLCTWDKNGMIVSMTLTLGSHLGTGEFSPLGFFYNNGLHNYSPKNVRYPKNYPSGAGPISAKSPIIVYKNDNPWLAIGGAGSNRIITNTALYLARLIQRPEYYKKLLIQPRYYLNQNQKLYVEWHNNPKLLTQLRVNYTNTEIRVGCDDYFGLISAIIATPEGLCSLGDHRRDGSCAAIDRNELEIEK